MRRYRRPRTIQETRRRFRASLVPSAVALGVVFAFILIVRVVTGDVAAWAGDVSVVALIAYSVAIEVWLGTRDND